LLILRGKNRLFLLSQRVLLYLFLANLLLVLVLIVHLTLQSAPYLRFCLGFPILILDTVTGLTLFLFLENILHVHLRRVRLDLHSLHHFSVRKMVLLNHHPTDIYLPFRFLSLKTLELYASLSTVQNLIVSDLKIDLKLTTSYILYFAL